MSAPEAPEPVYADDAGAGGNLPAFLRDPRGVLRRRWGWMVLTLVLGLAGTAVFVATLEPRYVASTTVLVTSQRISEAFVRSTVESDEFERINAIAAEILSRRSLTGLVEEHGLYADAEAPLSMEGRVARARDNAWIGVEEGVGRPQRGEEARIYAVLFRHHDPQVAAAVSNDLAERFTEAHLNMRNQQVRVATDFLRRELDRAERELREHEQRITEFKKRYRGELPGELGANLSKLERLQQERQSLALRIADAETRLAMLASGGGDIDPNSPEARLAAARARLDRELAVRTEEHPNVVSLKRQVEALEREVSGGAPSPTGTPSRSILARAARRTLEELNAQLARTESTIEELDARVQRTPEREEELAALTQRETVLREAYVETLRKVKQAELAQAVESAQQGERATILDKALPPGSPESPPLLFLLGGVAASLGLALGVGVLLELLDAVLLQADQIEGEFGVPVLGSISHIS